MNKLYLNILKDDREIGHSRTMSDTILRGLRTSCVMDPDQRPGSVNTGTLPPPVYLHISTPQIL